MTTLGFELEFTSGVEQLIRLLTERGFANQREERLHSYHCDCETCRDLDGVTFRAQRDSSCPGGGEIISGIFSSDDWDTATAAMHALQEAALDVDAAIDTNCGMHVHLGESDGDMLAPAPILSMAWLGVEPLLWEHVATSVWAQRRGSQNHLLSQTMVDMVQNSRIWDRHDIYPVAERDLGMTPMGFQQDYVVEFRRILGGMGWDRHCDLARANHGGVYEMRIFNATRVAWRIELACRLAVALADPAVATHFATATDRFLFGEEDRLSARMVMLRNGYRRGGRQYTGRDQPPLAQTLPVTMDDFMTTLSDFDEHLGELMLKQTGYVAARREVGLVRGPISNGMNLAEWDHAAVLERLNARSVDA